MTDATSVEELVAALIQSWNDHDAPRFGSLFSESADYVTGQGSPVRGRKLIAGLVRSNVTEKVILHGGPSIRLQGGKARVVFSWRSASGARRGVIRLEATRDDAGWHVDRLQNTDVA